MKILRYLKHSKRSDRKISNILLCSMQIVAPLEAEIVLQIAIAQVESLSMIIKGFVALGFVIRVDDMLSETFPHIFKVNAFRMVLVNGPDQNTF